jgi:hypothetical protein
MAIIIMTIIITMDTREIINKLREIMVRETENIN